MTALATTTDLRRVMQRELSTTDLNRATFLLDIASQQVRTFTGQTFTLTTETKRLRVRNGRVRLPQAPVTAVASVEDMDGNSVQFEWWAGQVVDCDPVLLNDFEINGRRQRLQWVDVAYTHGYTAIPDDVIGVVCDAVAVALDAPPEQVGVQQEQLGDYSVTSGMNAPGGVRLTQTMRDRLWNYSAHAGTIQTA